MFRQSVPLCTIFNIQIRLDFSWFLIFGLVIWSLATSYFPAQFAQWPTVEYWAVALVTALLFFASVLLHELGHSVIAKYFKIPVQNIVLFIFGGVSQITQEPPSAWSEFWIAIAGPLVSIGLAVIFGLLQMISSALQPVYAVVEYLALINLSLALFNLIPGFPLDGGRVLQAILWGITHNIKLATVISATVGRAIAFGIIFLGVWQMFSGNFDGGLWLAFIGWFLESAAAGQLQQQTLHTELAKRRAGEAMTRFYTLIPPDITLQRLADDHILSQGRRFFVVKDEAGKICGVFNMEDIQKIPRTKWAETFVGDVMLSIDQAHQAAPDTSLEEVVDKMAKDGIGEMPVVENGQLLGVIGREEIINSLRTKQPARI